MRLLGKDLDASASRIARAAFLAASILLLITGLASFVAWGIGSLSEAAQEANVRADAARRRADAAKARAETASKDARWFRGLLEEFRALEAEAVAVEDAIERQQASAKARWFSRSDDRKEFDRLNHRLVEVKSRRARLAKEYNVAAAGAPPEALAGLPASIAAVTTETNEEE